MAETLSKPQRSIETRDRRCLMCGDDFASEGAHNRICGKCKSSRTWRQGTPVSPVTAWKAPA